MFCSLPVSVWRNGRWIFSNVWNFRSREQVLEVGTIWNLWHSFFCFQFSSTIQTTNEYYTLLTAYVIIIPKLRQESVCSFNGSTTFIRVTCVFENVITYYVYRMFVSICVLLLVSLSNIPKRFGRPVLYDVYLHGHETTTRPLVHSNYFNNTFWRLKHPFSIPYNGLRREMFCKWHRCHRRARK